MKISLTFKHICGFVVAGFLLAACGNSDETNQRNQYFETATLEDIQAMVRAGDYQQALDILTYQRDAGRADTAHLLLMGQAHAALGDGISTEVIVEQLRDGGASEAETALLLARAYMLQGQYAKVEESLHNTRVTDSDRYEALLIRADAARARDEAALAARLYQEAVADTPDRPEGYTSLALMALQDRDIDRLQDYTAEAVTHAQRDPVVSYLQGMVSRYTGDVETAKQHFLEAIELNGTNVLARLELADLFLAEENVEDAQVQLDAVYARSPNNPLAHYHSARILASSGNFEEAASLMARTGEFVRSFPPATRLYALSLYETGKYAAATPLLERAFTTFPDDENIRAALLDALNQTHNAKQVLAVLAPLLDESQNPDDLVQASIAAIAQEKYALAQTYLERALSIAENSDLASADYIKDLRDKLVAVLIVQNDTQAASRLLADSVGANAARAEIGAKPEDLPRLVVQANQFITMADYDAAGKVVDMIESIAPESPEAANLKGVLHYRHDRIEEAIAAYSQAIARKADYQSALKNRALAYTALARYGQARADLEVLQKLAPSDPEAAALYGRALLETGVPKSALIYLEQAKAALPQNALVASDYADALAATGRLSDAVRAGGKAKALAAGNERLQHYLDEQIKEWRSALSGENSAHSSVAAEKGGQAGQVIITTISEDRNRLFGQWLTQQLRLTGADAEKYIHTLQRRAKDAADDTAFVLDVLNDLEDAGIYMTIQALERKLEAFQAEAESSRG